MSSIVDENYKKNADYDLLTCNNNKFPQNFEKKNII